MKNRLLLSQIFFWITILALHAQPARRPVEVIVTTDRAGCRVVDVRVNVVP